MKRFIKHSVYFIIPIIVLLITIEIIVGFIPNSYSYKYNYITQKGRTIKAIALGHSQLYDGFDPNYFGLHSFNLSNSAQTYIDNYYLLRELLPYLPHLRMVIIPIGYYNVDIITANRENELTDRSCYYHKYMHLDYDGSMPIKYRFESMDPRRTIEKIYAYYRQKEDIIGCDSTGRRSTHNLEARKHELGYEKEIEAYTKAEFNYHKLCIREEDYLIKAIEMLLKKHITIVMVSPPYYWGDNTKLLNHVQKEFVCNYINKLCKKYPIHYFDYETDTTFVYDDFYNETHLSELGAEKFTKKLYTNIINAMSAN